MSSSTVGNFATSNSLYAYLDGRFRQVTPTEIVASQKIYYRSKVSGTVPKPTAWVTLATNKYNDTVSVGNSGWSTKVTPIASSTAENVTKYLYLYTCEQRKRLDGTVECTAVTLDENTTIIDGGNIITHTVTADQLNATSINASNSLTVGAFNTSTQNDILNSNVQVGGRNLLQQSWRETQSSVTKSGITYTCNTDGSITLNGTSTAQHVFILAQSLTLSAGTYTLSGCPAGGGTNSYRLDILEVSLVGGTTGSVPDNGNGRTFETTGGTTGQVRIRVVSGQTLSNLTF